MPGAVGRELEQLYRIAQSVQLAVRQALHSPRRAATVGMGADGTPTEELDRVAERAVLEGLEREGVDWNLLSEEAGKVDRGGQRTLVVDPVDGSHNALRGMPFATVSFALGASTLGSVDVGLVRDLGSGVTRWAARGQGAFRDGERIHTRPWVARSELLFLNLGRHASPRSVQLAGRARRIRSIGCASAEIGFVAEGAADAYLFENERADRNLRVTDIAGAYRVLLESGGELTDASGGSLADFPLELDRRTSVLAVGEPGFLVKARSGGYL